MTVKQRCLRCNRWITRMKDGRGPFRRHVIKKGKLCVGSWEFPGEQKEHIQSEREKKAGVQ